MNPLLYAIYRFAADGSTGVVLAVAIIGLAYRPRMHRVPQWMVAWVTVDAVASVAAVLFRIFRGGNLTVAQTWYPCSAVLALCVLGSTLPGARGRRAAYLGAVAFGVVLVALTVGVEQFGSYSKLVGAIHGVTLLAVGAALLAQRAWIARGEMFRDPVFLIGIAFLSTGAPSSILTLSARYFGIEGLDLQLVVQTFKNIVSILAYEVMVVAFYLSSQRRAPQGSHSTVPVR